MRIVAANELQDWLSHSEVLEKDGRGVKVAKLQNGSILKIFRTRRRFFIARMRPAAKRFTTNAEKLQAAGIQTPSILDYFWIDREQAVSACIYKPLAGVSLDKLLHTDPNQLRQLLPALALYIRQMHLKGIYFRSLHLGNVLLTPDGRFGLIDFLDMRFKARPLSESLIRRNFDHLKGYLKRTNIEEFPIDELLGAYNEACKNA